MRLLYLRQNRFLLTLRQESLAGAGELALVPFTGFLDESTRARQFWGRAVREASHDSRRSVGRFLLFLLNPEDPRAGSVPFRHSSFRNAPGSWFGSEPQQKNEAMQSQGIAQ